MQMKTGNEFKCPECGGEKYGENPDGSVWCWQRGCGWSGSKEQAGIVNYTPIQLTESQFRRLVKTIYEEGFCDGKINGRHQDSEELWPLSKSKDYMERLIAIDAKS